MASNNIARLGVVLGIDTAEFTAGVDKAIAENKKLKASIQRETNAAAKEIIALKYATEDYGKAVTKVEQIQREIVGGRFRNATQQVKDQLLAQAAAYDKVAAASTKAKLAQMGMLGAQGAGGQLNQQQLAALSYQTTDIVTGLVSGQNPMMVLIQQGGQLRDQFGGVNNVFKAFASVLSPLRLLIGGVTGVLGALGYVAYKGSQDFKELRNALVMTNNVAGLTYDSVRRLSDELSNNLSLSLSDSNDIFLELIRSGKFTQESMGSVAESIGRLSRLTGESANVIAKELIPSFNGTASSAQNLNEKYNFLTAAQYRQIEALELAGNRQQAAKLTADLLNQSLERQAEELQRARGLWSNLTIAVSNFIEKLKQIGMPETDEEKLLRFARAYEDILKRAEAEGLDATVVEAALDRYLDQYKSMVEKRTRLEREAAKQQQENEKINNYIAAGGEKKRLEIIAETRKIYADMEFQERVANATEFQRIDLEAEKKKQEAANEFIRQAEQARGNFRMELSEQYNAKVLAAEFEREQRILEISRQAAEEVRKEQQNRIDSLATEKEKLQIYERNLLISETDYKIALNKLRAEQEIAKIRANQNLTPEAKEAAITKEEDIRRRSDELARLEERLQHLRDVNNAVFKNMESAITQFVQTGKLSFKDLAGSIIRDILAIYMKSQLLQMFNIGRSFISNIGFGTGMGYGSMDYGMFFADGGEPPVNKPAIVGERGPELFIPRTSGTIIPNHQLSSLKPEPQVVYNGPYIANMQAIDTQSATQFLSRNKEAVYAANLSATRSLPASR